MGTDSIASRSGAAFIVWYVTPRSTGSVVMVYAVLSKFLVFVYGMKRCYCCHWASSPLENSGTPRFGPNGTIERSFSNSRDSLVLRCICRRNWSCCSRSCCSRGSTLSGRLNCPRGKTWTSKRGPLSVKFFSCWLLLVELREGQSYINRIPCREAHVRATELLFGGITECEGGGGWVSRTPFLSGTADYKSAPGKPTSQPPAIWK